MDTRFLWVQEYVDSGRIRLREVSTGDMLADLMTKPLDGGTMQKLLTRMCYYVITSTLYEAFLHEINVDSPKP